MDIFKLVGSIFIKNDDANSQIDTTTTNAKSMASTIGSAMETAGQKISAVGKALAPISIATGAMLTASVKGASDFTNGMAKMSTLFDTTKTSVSDLSKQFLTLSNDTGISATELAEAGYQALSAGQSVDKVGKFVETAGKLAKAGFTSTTTAVDVLTTAMNAYGEEAGSAEQISNKLVRTQNLGKTTVDELASSMGKIIPTASSMGVNIDNLTSGYVSLTKQGIATAEATTYMNSMLNELGDSGTTLGGVLKEKTGKSFQDLMNEGYSLADVLQITKDYADENNIAYNELWGSAEAGKAGLAILNGGVEEFNSTVETMKSDVDDVGEALDKLETPSVKVQKSLNRVKNSGIELGTTILNALTPALDRVSKVIEKATNWFSGLNDKTKTIIASVLGVVTALAPVLMIGGKVVSGVGKAIGIIGKLHTSVGGLSGVIGAVTSPVGLVIIAIGALIAIFVALYQKNENFRNAVNTAWDAIKTKIGGVIEAVKGLIEAVINRIQIIIQTFVSVAKSLWSMFGDDIINVLSNAFNVIQTVVQVALDVIKGIIQTVTAIINGDWEGAWNAIKSTLSTVWNGIKSIAKAGIEYVKSVIQLALNVIKTVWSAVWNAIKSVASTIWNGIKSVITSVINAIKSVITSVMNAIKSTITSVMNGIKSTITTVWNTIKTTISNAINGVKSTISSGLNSAKSTVTSVLSAISSKFTSIFNTVKSTVQNAINRVKSIMNFSWSLPHLKLPHISISGSFSINPPSVPHFGISWYKKAMEDPLLFTKPTLFDVNPVTGQAKGAGEAGDEMMYGHKNLMNDIRNASGIENLADVFEDWMNRMFDLFLQYFPQFANMQVVMDGGALVGQIAPEVDKQLGIITTHKGRGN